MVLLHPYQPALRPKAVLTLKSKKEEPQPPATTCSTQPVAVPGPSSLSSSSSSIPAPGTTRYPLKKGKNHCAKLCHLGSGKNIV